MNQPLGSCGSGNRTIHQDYSNRPTPARTRPEKVDPPGIFGALGDEISDFRDLDSHQDDLDFHFDNPDVEMETEENETELPEVPPAAFVELYEGCSEAFPGGKSFMDNFRQDRYAAERQENLYFPFASQEEWQFASWLLRSHLSLSAIDSLLSLDIVSNDLCCLRTRI